MTRVCGKCAAWLTALALALGAIGPTSGRTDAASTSSISGEAYGAVAHTSAGTLARSPLAVLNPDDGMADAVAASLDVPNVITAESLSSIATGAIGENAASTQSSSTLQNVSVLTGLVTAKAVVAMASSTSNGTTASSSAAGATFVELVVKGVPLGDGAPPPNTRIDVPGVGTVILNEQVPSGNGTTAAALSVRMIRVELKDALTGVQTGEVVVGAAESAVAFAR